MGRLVVSVLPQSDRTGRRSHLARRALRPVGPEHFILLCVFA